MDPLRRNPDLMGVLSPNAIVAAFMKSERDRLQKKLTAFDGEAHLAGSPCDMNKYHLQERIKKLDAFLEGVAHD